IIITGWLTRLRYCTLERGNTVRTWRFRRPSSSIKTVSSAPSSAQRVLLVARRPARAWQRWIRCWPSREQNVSYTNHEESDNHHEKEGERLEGSTRRRRARRGSPDPAGSADRCENQGAE